MCKLIAHVFCLILLVSLPVRVYCADIPQYIAGAYTSLLFHELGHAGVATWYGASDVSIEIPRKNASIYSGATYYKGESSLLASPTFRKKVSLAGLISANLAGEIVLRQRELHGNAFAQGVLSAAQMSNMAHVYKYYTGFKNVDGMRNDITSYEDAGGNPHILSAILLSYSIWSLKRMSDKSIPLFGVKIPF